MTKIGNKIWTISKAEMTLLFFSVLYFFLFFLFFLYTESSIFLEKFIGQWIPDRDGRGIASDIKKIISLFKTWQKMVTKLGQLKQLKCPNFVNCPNFVTNFCQVLKMKIFFFDIPSNPPPIPVRNSLTKSIFSKKLMFLYIFKKIKIRTSLYRDIHPGDSWPYMMASARLPKYQYWLL